MYEVCMINMLVKTFYHFDCAPPIVLILYSFTSMDASHFQQVEEAERAYWAKYQKQASEQEVTYPKPFFIRPLQPSFSLNENQVCFPSSIICFYLINCENVIL